MTMDRWFIPVNIVIGAVLGCTLGYLMALLVRPPPQFFNFFVIMVGIGNIGNIPLVIIGAICRPDDNPFGQDSETCNSEGVAYISFGQWVGAVVVYTFVFHVLAPPKDANKESSAEIDIKVESISPDHIDDANGFSQTNFLPYNIQKEDSISVPLLLPQSYTTGQLE